MVAGKVRLQHNREKLDVTRGTLNATNQIPGAVLIVRFRLAGIGSPGEGVHGFIARKLKRLPPRPYPSTHQRSEIRAERARQ